MAERILAGALMPLIIVVAGLIHMGRPTFNRSSLIILGVTVGLGALLGWVAGPFLLIVDIAYIRSSYPDEWKRHLGGQWEAFKASGGVIRWVALAIVLIAGATLFALAVGRSLS